MTRWIARGRSVDILWTEPAVGPRDPGPIAARSSASAGKPRFPDPPAPTSSRARVGPPRPVARALRAPSVEGGTMRKILLAVPVVALSLAGCASLKDLARAAFNQPRLTFKSAALGALDLEGATLAFTWEIENPNALGLDLARGAWQVEVEGTR